MSVAEVKGWCPGILRPMLSGDGLIVRVRPRGGAFDLATAAALADLAERLGNGHIDLTRRANLQLRGLTEDRLPELQMALAKLGLLDPDAETEAVRNVMVAPLAGLDPTSVDVRPIAVAIDDALTAEARLRALPGKFGLLVDGGGVLPIAGERADICLAPVGNAMALGLDRPRERTGWACCRRHRRPTRRSSRHTLSSLSQRAAACAVSPKRSYRRCRRPWDRACRRWIARQPSADGGSGCWEARSESRLRSAGWRQASFAAW